LKELKDNSNGTSAPDGEQFSPTFLRLPTDENFTIGGRSNPIILINVVSAFDLPTIITNSPVDVHKRL
jgi:hypothetical protein